MSDYNFGADLPEFDSLPTPLARQRARDLLEAEMARQDAQHESVFPLAPPQGDNEQPFNRYRRAPLNWPCKLDERYCAHKPACASALPYSHGKRR